MLIACDVDSVVADLMPVWIGKYNKDYGDKLNIKDLRTWEVSDYVKKECGNRIFDYIEDPTIYDLVWPTPQAVQGIQYLRWCGHRVVFVTSSTAGALGAKLRWLRQWGFLDKSFDGLNDYVEARDKSLIRANVLIDDYDKNLRRFSGVGIMYTQPWNEDIVWGFRMSGWQEVLDDRIVALRA